MRRLFTIAATVAILLLAFAPSAFAADPVSWSGRGAIISVHGTVDVPAGQTVDAIVVVDGTATVEGTVNSIVLVRSTATLTGATTRHLVVVNSTANLGPATTVTETISTLQGTVVRDPAAVVTARTTTLDTNMAAFAFALIPLLILIWLGVYVAMVVAGLALAAFGARQVRAAESMITRKPGQSLAVGVIATLALPILFGIVTVTVIGAPVGLTMLLIGLPMLAFVGWLVAAIWIGDWMLNRHGPVDAAHPYKAAVLGVIVLAIVGILPFVSAIATVFGLGGVLLAVWEGFRPEPTASVATSPEGGAGWPEPLPTAG